jgi:hypothetical protein
MQVMRKMVIPCALVFGGLLLGVALHAQTTNPLSGYTGYTNSYFLPYDNSPGFGSANPTDAAVKVSIGTLNIALNLDTGSRGLFISSDTLSNNVTTNASSFAGQIDLSSSHRVYLGDWTTTAVNFSVTNQSGIATNVTASIPILDVQTIASEGSGTATFSIVGTAPVNGNVTLTNGALLAYTNRSFSLSGGQAVSYSNNVGLLSPVSNFGVGFDLNGHGTGPVTNNENQSYNAFLNLGAMTNGSMVAGYIITPTGVQLGLTQTTTNFAYTKLQPTGFTNAPALNTAPDWQTPTGQVVYGGVTNAAGSVVLDSGIGYSFLSLPGLTNGGLSNPPLSINLINSGGAVGYKITTDSNNILNPSFNTATSNVTLSAPSGGIYSQNQSPIGDQYFNSGRNVFNAFDMLYDGQNGYVGLITNSFGATDTNVFFQSGFYASPLPEPSTYTLLGLSLSGLALVMAQRHRAS